MQDHEYEELIAELREQFRKADISYLGDEILYLQRDSEFGHRHLPEPRILLAEMLRALDRFLAVSDLSTYELAIATINESLTKTRVAGAEITLADKGPKVSETLEARPDRETRRVDFAGLPSLRKVRYQLTRLIEAIEGPKSDPEPDPEPNPEPGPGDGSAREGGLSPMNGL